jgi:ankyrin repeat protein
LIRAGANPNERNEHGTTALHTAASVLSEEVASLLLQAGAAIDEKSILVDEYSSKGVNWVESPSPSPRGALSSPTMGSDGGGGGKEGKPSPRSRKEYKDETAAEHETPLHVAVRKGALAMARFLLQRGAAVDSTDQAGKTSLHIALENLLEASRIGNAAETQRCLALVQLLLESSACPLLGNQVLGKKRTTVHWAVQHGHVDALEVLVAHTFGSTKQQLLDAQDERGVTALMLAAREGKVGCLEALLRNGADAGLRNTEGMSARDLAAAEGMEAALCIIDTFATFASMA